MERLNVSLLLLLVFCSSSAGKTFWTHLGTRCIEDCKVSWGDYKCKTIDEDGQCQTMYCSPKTGVDYWGRQCSGRCEKNGNDYYSCKISLIQWGYCGLVMDGLIHYGSFTGAQCFDYCEQRGQYYYWCHTEKGWDYCSPYNNTDYMNNQCKEDSPCEKRTNDYKWCAVAGGWGYCGLVEPKMFLHRSKYHYVCIDRCQYYQKNDYYWCHIENSWDYCSPEVDVTYKGTPCRSDHSCGLHGYGYNWCWTSDKDYDYCGPIEPEECTYIDSKHRSKRADANNPQRIVICTQVDRGNRISTTFSAVPAPNAITDGRQFREEIENLVSFWDNGNLVEHASSNLMHSANVRIDMQGIINRNNQRYYNLQVQLNRPRRPGESTTVSQVIVPRDVPARYIRRAFNESFRRRARVFIDVTRLNQC